MRYNENRPKCSFCSAPADAYCEACGRPICAAHAEYLVVVGNVVCPECARKAGGREVPNGR